MNFKPDEKNIRSLLKSGCQFVIPRFQREYSWDKKNYQEFFEDMINNLVASSGVINDDQYFLGTMLFVGNFAEKPDKPIEVVDGQQRLTTITILFSVLSDRFRELGEDTLSKQLFNYITTTDDNGEKVRVLQSKSSYPYFVYYIQDREKQIPTVPSTEEENCIQETYEFFLQQTAENSLKKLLKKRTGDDIVNSLSYVDILKALRDQVLDCTFISIAAADKDQANRINKTFNVVQTRIALLALYDIKGRNLVSTDQFKKAILAIENFHFAFTAVCSMRTNNLEKIYSRFAIALRKCTNKSEASKIIDEKLIVPLGKLYPSYDVFSAKFKELFFTKKEDPANVKCKYAIYKLNCYFSGKDIFEDDGSIEHILSETTGDRTLNIGNLILLEGKVNSSAGQKSYVEKIPCYQKSQYIWIKRFIEVNKDWDEGMINERAERLSAVYYKEILKQDLPKNNTIKVEDVV